MSVNLIDVLKNAFTENVYDRISRNVELDRDAARSGVGAVIPTVLASILGKNTTTAYNEPTWWNSLTGLFTRDEDEMYVDVVNDPLYNETGNNVYHGLFGSNRDTIVEAIARKIGLGTDKASGFLSTVVPLVTGYLANWIRRKGWSFGDLIGNLFDNRSSIVNALPAGVSPALFGLAADTPEPVQETVYTEPEPVRETVTTPPPAKSNNLLWWVIGVLLLAVLLWWLLGNRGCTRQAVVNDTQDSLVISQAPPVDNSIRGSLNEAGDWVYDLGQDVNLRLRDGNELVVGENSVENRLVRFIEGDNPVDKETWFSFDRLYFETGSSTLKAESRTQLQNIADIMKAYPDVNLKIGGYTDNTGTDDVNLNLSQERAETALNELVNLGVDKARMEAEGYGSQHPVASNDTPEGRAQNRRIDVRVTKK